METIGDRVRALVTLGGASLRKRESTSVQRVLDERMTLSESIEAATAIIDCYPNGGRDIGKGYIGALAATLASYPRQVALRCADRLHGVVRECRFLPTPADIVAWCQCKTEELHGHRARELRVAEQLRHRAIIEHSERTVRPRRLSLAELKEKYGDWSHGWKPPGRHQRQLSEGARAMLVGIIGQEVFDALPNAPEKPAGTPNVAGR